MNFSETIFLFFLALIIFGPKKLPEIARQAGKWMNEFRRASNEFKAQIEQEIAHLEVENRKQTILPPSPAPAGTASRTLNAAPSEASPAPPYSAYAPEPSASQTPAAPPANAVAPDDEPLFATAAPADAKHGASAATEAPPAEAVAASNSQEPHA